MKNGTGTIPQIAGRRSKRSVGSGRFTSPTNRGRIKSKGEESPTDLVIAEQMKAENEAKVSQQEERSFVRALESYGPESQSLVRSHILPVYGSTRRRNPSHITDRWKR